MPSIHQPTLPWLQAGDAFPPVHAAWDAGSPAPGLLAAGGALDVATLRSAYAQGIFPWYSAGQPTLWWSPDPRMVLRIDGFKLHRSLRKTLQKFKDNPACEIRIDFGFEAVMRACATSPRKTQQADAQDGEGSEGDEAQSRGHSPDSDNGNNNATPHTWIQPDMVAAYTALHRAGMAHSVETWVNGRLVGGLYCTALGAAVFGESMFSRASDASKIALCALVALCRAQGVARIDCQQNTPHLASLGAQEMPRTEFCQHVAQDAQKPAIKWQFEPIYWSTILPQKHDY
jgi:leucyl/phenylalanyl-tRNA---protein transferase